MTKGFGEPLTDAERDMYRARRLMPALTITVARPEPTIYILHPGSFLRDARGYVFEHVVDRYARTIAASEDLAALHAAARLLSGHAERTRGGVSEPMYFASARGGLPEAVYA